MRIVAEIMLDRRPNSIDATPEEVAREIDERFLPPAGLRIFVSDDKGEAEYIITSTKAWHEDMTPEMTERQMTAETGATSTDANRAYRSMPVDEMRERKH